MILSFIRFIVESNVFLLLVECQLILKIPIFSYFNSNLISEIDYPSLFVMRYEGGVKCDSYGWPLEGTRLWWKYYHYPKAPSLLDIFADDGILYAIINLKNIPTKKQFLKSKWRCQFKEQLVDDLNNGHNCGHGHSHVVKCLIPKGTHFQVTIKNSYESFSFSNVPFCTLPKAVGEPKELHVCTQNYPEHHISFSQWALWHVMQGFSTPTIYLVANSSAIYRSTLGSLIDRGLIRFVKWDWPYNKNFAQQQGEQLSCIYRSRRRYKWVLMSDVDEFSFSQSMEIRDIVKRYDNFSNIGGLKACNHFYYESQNLYKYRNVSNFDLSDGKCVIGRGKILVRPENINYFSVHMITDGGKLIHLPELVLKSAHLKKFQMKDTSRDPDDSLKPMARKLQNFYKFLSFPSNVN